MAASPRAAWTRIDRSARRRVHRTVWGRDPAVADLLPEQAKLDNLTLALDALREAGAQGFVIPTRIPFRHRIGILRQDYDAFLTALTGAHVDEPVYLCEVLAGARGHIPRPVSAKGTKHWASEHSVLRLFREVESTSGTLTYGQPYGVDLEVWEVGADGEWVGPRPNAVTEVVPAEFQSFTEEPDLGPDVPTLAVFQVRDSMSVHFPIDVVWTWVDGSDPRWLESFRSSLRSTDPDAVPTGAVDPARFRDGGELRYSVRSVEMFAPWARRLIFVTADQVPPWLDLDDPRVTVVSHREIFPPEALPTFNSQAIASRLHHIPGLAEHFVYLNDDVMLGRPLSPSFFFEPSGLPVVFPSTVAIPPGPATASDTAPTAAGRIMRDLLLRDFDRSITHRFRHSPHALRKSTMLELESRYAEAWASTSASSFRSPTNVSPESFAHHHGLITGGAVARSARYQYVSPFGVNAKKALADLLKQRATDFFCLNDMDPEDETSGPGVNFADFLAAYFPVPSRLETDARASTAAAVTRR